MKPINKLLLTATLSMLAWQANAASVSLEPSLAEVNVGGEFMVALNLDASDAPGDLPGSFSGLVNITFNAAEVQYDGFTFSAPASELESPTLSIDSGVATLSLGFFNALDVSEIGTISFTALAAPNSVISFDVADADYFFGSFANEVPSNQPFFPDFIGTQLTVVPLPATAWLMISGLGLLYSVRRRRSAAEEIA